MEPPRTITAPYRIQRFKGGPQLIARFAERCQPLGHVGKFFQSGFTKNWLVEIDQENVF